MGLGSEDVGEDIVNSVAVGRGVRQYGPFDILISDIFMFKSINAGSHRSDLFLQKSCTMAQGGEQLAHYHTSFPRGSLIIKE